MTSETEGNCQSGPGIVIIKYDKNPALFDDENHSMPVHRWNRVPAGVFHAFYNAWITHLQEALNDGLLPTVYYALGEREFNNLKEADEAAFHLTRRRTIALRHVSGDRLVALLEIVSPANKHNRRNVDQFVDKIVAALRKGIHVLVVDLIPSGGHDPQGMVGAVWEQMMAGVYQPANDEPLTLSSFVAGRPATAYIEPLAVGKPLWEMPLFLTADRYINTPLEATYLQAYHGNPQRWRDVIESDE